MTVEDILSRRSIRKYTDEAVSSEMIEQILQAAMAAPSAMHKDPWHFIVLTEREQIDALASCLPNGKMLVGAPLALIACGDLAQAHASFLSYLLQDVTAAVENALLAVHALGLGACWLGIHPREERVIAVSEHFALPEGIVPIAGIAIGHPAEQPASRTRYDATKVHTNRW